MKHLIYLSVSCVVAMAMAACTGNQATSGSISSEDSTTVVDTAAMVDIVEATQPEADSIVEPVAAEPDKGYDEAEAKAFATRFIKQGKPLAYRLSSAKKFMTTELYAKCKSYTSNTSIENEGEEPYLAWGEEDNHITRPGVFVKSLGNGEFCGTLSEVSDFAGDEGGYSNYECTIIVDKVDGEYKVVNIYNYMKRRYEL